MNHLTVFAMGVLFMDRKLNRVRVFSAFLLVCGATFGCATAPTVTDETSHDGLVKVTKTGFDQVWVRKGADLKSFSKIQLEGVGIEYRPVKCKTSTLAAASDTVFCLDDRQKTRLREIVGKVFAEEMGKSKQFQLTTTPGPDVLLVRGALLDVVSFVPPTPIGRSDVFLRSVGEATLILEIRDPASGAILARIADRRAAERAGSMPQRSNSVTNGYEVERVARAWATILRDRLDAVKTLTGT